MYRFFFFMVVIVQTLFLWQLIEKTLQRPLFNKFSDLYGCILLFLTFLLTHHDPYQWLFKILVPLIVTLMMLERKSTSLVFTDFLLLLMFVIIHSFFFEQILLWGLTILPYQWTGRPVIYLLIVITVYMCGLIVINVKEVPAIRLLFLLRKNLLLSVVGSIMVCIILLSVFKHYRYMNIIFRNLRLNNQMLLIGFLIYTIGYLIGLLIHLVFERIRLRKQQLSHLESYVAEYEKLYQQVATFRHDYQNILHSIKLSLNQNDLEAVREIYEDVIEPTGKFIEIQDTSVNKLKMIESLSLRSVFYEKILECRKRAIEINLVIEKQLFLTSINSVNLIRSIGIIFDNAIEASAQAEFKMINVLITTYSDFEVQIKIQNTYREDAQLKERLFNMNRAVGKQKGWGLYTLRQIVEQESDWFLMTEFDSMWVSQILVMQDKY